MLLIFSSDFGAFLLHKNLVLQWKDWRINQPLKTMLSLLEAETSTSRLVGTLVHLVSGEDDSATAKMAAVASSSRRD